MTREFEFRVSRQEADFLGRLARQNRSMAPLIKFEECAQTDQKILHFDRSEARQVRKWLTTQLALAGFDQNYDLNKEGQILEDLIDRFFVP